MITDSRSMFSLEQQVVRCQQDASWMDQFYGELMTPTSGCLFVCLFVSSLRVHSSRVAEAQTAKPPGRSAALRHCAVLPVRPRNKAPDSWTAGAVPLLRGANLLAVRMSVLCPPGRARAIIVPTLVAMLPVVGG